MEYWNHEVDLSPQSSTSTVVVETAQSQARSTKEPKTTFKTNMLKAMGLVKSTEDITEPETRRRFLFDDRALLRGGQMKDLFLDEEPPEQDINDVVDADDRRIEHFVSEHLVGGVVDGGYFKAFIFFLIVVNSILIALQTDEVINLRYRFLFSIFDQIVLATFVCELLLKWYYGFWIFWKVGWNVLDFMIIAALMLGPQLSFLSSSRILRILRVLRAFRSLRSISALAGLSLVVQTILQSIPDMANIVLLLVIVLLVFGVSGVTLFGKNVPDRFGDLQSALFSLFICVTQDGWVDIYNSFKEQGMWVHAGGMLYFFCSIMIGAFVFANLVVAVVVTNLEMAMKIHKAEHADAAVDYTLTSTDEEGSEEHAKVLLQKNFNDNNHYRKQNPLLLADFSNLNVESITMYFMLITALEENLVEYQNIRQDLESVYTAVAALNVVQEEAESPLMQAASSTSIKKRPGATIDIKNVRKGDILSNLMKLEEQHVFSSKDKQTMHGLFKSLRTDQNETAANNRHMLKQSSLAIRRHSVNRRASISLRRGSMLGGDEVNNT